MKATQQPLNPFIYRFYLITGIVFTVIGLYQAAHADSSGTSYVHNGKEVTKFEAMRTLLASNNKEVIKKCTEVYMDERKGTIRNR